MPNFPTSGPYTGMVPASSGGNPMGTPSMQDVLSQIAQLMALGASPTPMGMGGNYRGPTGAEMGNAFPMATPPAGRLGPGPTTAGPALPPGARGPGFGSMSMMDVLSQIAQLGAAPTPMTMGADYRGPTGAEMGSAFPMATPPVNRPGPGPTRPAPAMPPGSRGPGFGSGLPSGSTMPSGMPGTANPLDLYANSPGAQPGFGTANPLPALGALAGAPGAQPGFGTANPLDIYANSPGAQPGFGTANPLAALGALAQGALGGLSALPGSQGQGMFTPEQVWAFLTKPPNILAQPAAAAPAGPGVATPAGAPAGSPADNSAMSDLILTTLADAGLVPPMSPAAPQPASPPPAAKRAAAAAKPTPRPAARTPTSSGTRREYNTDTNKFEDKPAQVNNAELRRRGAQRIQQRREARRG